MKLKLANIPSKAEKNSRYHDIFQRVLCHLGEKQSPLVHKWLILHEISKDNIKQNFKKEIKVDNLEGIIKHALYSQVIPMDPQVLEPQEDLDIPMISVKHERDETSYFH